MVGTRPNVHQHSEQQYPASQYPGLDLGILIVEHPASVDQVCASGWRSELGTRSPQLALALIEPKPPRL